MSTYVVLTQAVIKVWRVIMRLMGDLVDYKKNYEQFAGHRSHQPVSKPI